MSHLTIIFEGNIASGKTTLCRKFSWPVIFEDVGPEFTRLFYSQPEKYGFALQMTLHSQRLASLGMPAPEPRVIDRSIIGDWAFALWNRAIGNMSQVEWQVYQERAGRTPAEVAAKFPKNTVLVYLQDSPQHCQRRLVSRGNADAQVPLSYLQGIHAAHLIALAALPDTVQWTRMPWSKYESVQQCGIDFVEKIVEQAKFRTADDQRNLELAAVHAIDCVADADANMFLHDTFTALMGK